MRDFSWSCFQVTGSVDAYLLYKDLGEETALMMEERETEQETDAEHLQIFE